MLLQINQVNFLALVLHKISSIWALEQVILILMEPLMVMLERLQVRQISNYITEVGTAAGYKVITPTVTGVSTSVTTGLSTAWDAESICWWIINNNIH